MQMEQIEEYRNLFAKISNSVAERDSLSSSSGENFLELSELNEERKAVLSNANCS